MFRVASFKREYLTFNSHIKLTQRSPTMHPILIFRTKELGGGTVIDMGTYCCQFASLVFSGLTPEKIIASGHLNSSGADDSSSATIIYPNGKTATLVTHSQVNFPCEALAIGTKGTLKVSGNGEIILT